MYACTCMLTHYPLAVPYYLNNRYMQMCSSVKTAQRNWLLGVKAANFLSCIFICPPKFIVSFCSLQWTVKGSKVNNGCHKQCASCTSLHLHCMNGIRWVILARGMSSQTSWITRHNIYEKDKGGGIYHTKAVAECIEPDRFRSLCCELISGKCLKP